MRLALNMIVKNEAARIERMLNSVVQFIEAASIVDTGSTDNTREVIRAFFEAHKIPCEIIDAPFVDWSQARNEALRVGRYFAPRHNCDYILLMDADMEIVVKDVVQFLDHKTGPSYDMYQHAGALHYLNRRLVKVDTTGGYLGVTHEFLNIPAAGMVPESVAYFIDHADGANRPEKFKRDIRLLKAGLKVEPNNERYFYYLAQSYRDAGELDKAIKWYTRRVEAGGWDEEVWSAQYNMAQCHLANNNEAEFICHMLAAYNMRPSRAESLYDLAHHYRMKSMNAPAAMLAETGMALPRSTDALFVNDFVYAVGLKEELAITGFYVPGKKAKGFEVADHLSLQAGPYGNARELARYNLYWYLPKLSEVCHSFKAKQIAFEPPDGWTALNPSVARVGNSLMAVIRTVNYTMDDQGRYLIKSTNGEANATNPINTRNYLTWLGADPLSEAAPTHAEIHGPLEMPCEFPPVIGFEDMRLIPWKGELWASSCVRQLHQDGMPEQVLTRIYNRFGATPTIQEYKRMLRTPRACEKNWAPILEPDKPLRFMYRPGEVVDDEGATVIKHNTGLATDHISGSSQLVPFEGGWLSICHEARNLPGSHLRYYYHRFAMYGSDFSLHKLSRPFVFHDKQIEFCAGLCWHPDSNHLVLSYGVKDCEAWLAVVDHAEISKLLNFGSR
jgi:tetratricopeptide (TPR) repeat protein